MKNNGKKIDVELIEKSYIINENGTIFGRKRGKFRKPHDNYGYDVINLSLNNKKGWYSVHRLVATKYVPNPHNKPQVNHKDGDKKNNHYSNLEWVTQSENIKHSIYEIGKLGHGAAMPTRVSRNGVVYESMTDAENKTGIFRNIISDSINGLPVPSWAGSWKKERRLRKL